MSVIGLNHFNLTAPVALIELVKDFYVEVLGLRVGERPNFSRGGYWLYAGDKPLVHLVISNEGDDRSPCESYLDHVAFSCVGLNEFIERLKANGAAYVVDEVPARNQVQVFVRDPTGVRLELNFEG